MKRRHSIAIGKAVKKLAALRGGGSALPGLVIEKLDKNFVKHSLEQLPEGVVLVSGTNGKTTTTKMVAELLESSGLRVFTNKTGSNFTRGVAAALLGAIDKEGQLEYDIAVLELDEAYAAHFVRQVSPRYSLILNVMRDQLDRFGEIDHTAHLLETVAKATTDGVVLNRDDPRVARIASLLPKKVAVRYFGSSAQLRSLFVSDDDLYAPKDQKITASQMKPGVNDVELFDYQGNNVTFIIGKTRHVATLKLTGVYNFLNAAGALAISKFVTGKKSSDEALIKSLESVTPAFGRGEIFKVNEAPLELILVKNPAGFRLALSSFSPKDTDIMIAINDRYADGRDMSWLWDVDFSGLQNGGVQTVSGVRAYDMALRLQYDDVTVSKVNTDLEAALKQFVSRHKKVPKRIFCTYTAMLALRKSLNRYTEVEKIS
jgi:lipid II isoglutaminyl synthase (glutamine-hydrolysing)